ncbi:MAG TPA: SPW repeat protein [Thermodesulfobacteriota bacterium]|nr:SPW repeat protein [Thermodesulfobacteriota bacterium]
MRIAPIPNRLNWLVVLLGLWQIMAPYFLDYSNVPYAMVNSLAVGVLFIVFAIWSIRTASLSTSSTLNTINVILALWLIAAPYVLGYSEIDRAATNNLVVGFAVIVIEALIRLLRRRQVPLRTEEPASHPA